MDQPKAWWQDGQRVSDSAVDARHQGQGSSPPFSSERSMTSLGSISTTLSRELRARANRPVVAVAATRASNNVSSSVSLVRR